MNKQTKFNLDYFTKMIPIIVGKYNITPKQAELALRSQFDFIIEEIQSENFSNIKLKHLGRFIVNESRKKKWQTWKDKSNSSGSKELPTTEIGYKTKGSGIDGKEENVHL
jgi:nucleoid DNA-binding protein